MVPRDMAAEVAGRPPAGPRVLLATAIDLANRRGGGFPERPSGRQADTSSASPADKNIGKDGSAGKGTLDIMDGLPAGTDADGRPIVVSYTSMKSWAERMENLADLIAACKT